MNRAMKNMRTLLYAAGWMCAFIAFLSCSDDILDKTPTDAVGEEDMFADEALLQDFVNGTYLAMRQPFNDENSLTDGLTDNAYNQHGSAASVINTYLTAEVASTTGEGVTRNLWSHAFEYIRRTNLFFEGTENSSLDADALAQMDGEMHFLRAYLYFDLLKWYGEVPAITYAFSLDDETFDVERNSIEDVVDLIVADCDAAINELYTIDHGSYELGRACVESAMALKARALLYAASALFNPEGDATRWQEARDANKAVMDLTTCSLISAADAYGDIFTGENEDEVILARYFSQTNNQGYGVNLWLFPNGEGGWATTTPTQDLVDSYEMTTGELPAESGSYDDQNPYVNRDPRFAQSILYNGAPFKEGAYEYFVDKDSPSDSDLAGKDSPSSSIAPHNASRTGYNFRKWVQEDQGEYSGNTGPWVIFRKAEFYLNYAETQIALGEEDEARAAINAVRARVDMPAVTETGTELLERYRRERRVELALEDHRFFDMRRWKRGPEMLNKDAEGVTVYHNSGTDQMEYVYGTTADNTRQWNDKLYWLPIPYDEIQRSNGALTQNDGY